MRLRRIAYFEAEQTKLVRNKDSHNIYDLKNSQDPLVLVRDEG